MSTFFGLNIGRLGMQAQQKALEVTSHNIANANTLGYSRQIAHMTPTAAIPYSGKGMLGSGVVVSEVARVRDNFLDMQIRKELQTLGKWESRQYVLNQVEYIFMEPLKTGFNSVMSAFFDSWQELSLSPEGSPVRSALIQNANTLVNSVKHTHEQLKAIRNDIDQYIGIKIQEVNTLAEQIKDLNVKIVSLTIKNETPGDLLDRRDNLIDQLSQIIEFDAVQTDRGSVNIFIGGRTLVNESQAFRLSTKPGESVDGWPTAPAVIWEANGSHVKMHNGQIAGLIETRDTHLRRYMEDFESMAWGIINAVNTVHQQGMDLNGDTGLAFFTGNYLEELAVNHALITDLSKIAASTLDATANPGDGSNAVKIAQLRHRRISIDTTQTDLRLRVSLDPNGVTTFESYYRDNIARIGVDAQESGRMVENQHSLLAMMNKRKDSISGVSIDEELANMVQFQLAYQASARVISAFDEIYDTLINRMMR